MVRPNQIIQSNLEDGELTFLMFARSVKQVKRRVLYLNFPSTIRSTILGDEDVDDFIKRVEVVTTGTVNRYAVTVNTSKLTKED